MFHDLSKVILNQDMITNRNPLQIINGLLLWIYMMIITNASHYYSVRSLIFARVPVEKSKNRKEKIRYAQESNGIPLSMHWEYLKLCYLKFTQNLLISNITYQIFDFTWQISDNTRRKWWLSSFYMSKFAEIWWRHGDPQVK